MFLILLKSYRIDEEDAGFRFYVLVKQLNIIQINYILIVCTSISSSANVAFMIMKVLINLILASI